MQNLFTPIKLSYNYRISVNKYQSVSLLVLTKIEGDKRSMYMYECISNQECTSNLP